MYTGIYLDCIVFVIGALFCQLPRIISVNSLSGVYSTEAKGLNNFTTKSLQYSDNVFAGLYVFYFLFLGIGTVSYVIRAIADPNFLTAVGYVFAIVLQIIGYISFFSMSNYEGNSYKFAEKNTSKLVEKINYSNLKKYYSEDVSSSIAKLYTKGITQYHQEAKTEFQRNMNNVAKVVIDNKDSKIDTELIEKTLKEAKYVNLISSVINLIEDERLYEFIITTEDGAETVKSLSKQLKELELTIHNQSVSANRIKYTVDSSELIMEIENLTSSSIKTS